MHQTGVVTDEQGAAPQRRRRGEQVKLADQIDPPPLRDRSEQRFRLRPLVRCGEHGDTGTGQWAIRRCQAPSQLGEALRPPLLAAPIRRRSDCQIRALRADQCARRTS